jgi:ABC-type branched-subunit amino acid transport system substrate-binding protein
MLRVSGPLVAVLAVALTLTACTTTPPAATPPPTATPVAKTGDGILRIGTLFPVTGNLSFLGPAQTAGVDAAVAEINAAGGFEGKPVQVVHQDSGAGTPAAAIAALIAAKVDVVIGPSTSTLVQSVLPAAAAAHLALISPAATFPGLATAADAAYFFRTIPAYATQAYALAEGIPVDSRKRVAIVYADDSVGGSLAKTLPVALGRSAGKVVASVPIPASAPDYAAVVAKVVAAKPTAVVLATEGGATPQTLALITALTAAKLGGAALWLTSQNLADYSQALSGGVLTGVNGVLEGAAPDPAFVAQLQKVNGSLGSTLYAAEAYDATILAALAATSARDDGGAAIASHLRATSIGGITCASWAECTTVLKTDSDIDYGGVSGPLDLASNGDLTSAYYGIYGYAAGNTYSRVSTVLVGPGR